MQVVETKTRIPQNAASCVAAITQIVLKGTFDAVRRRKVLFQDVLIVGSMGPLGADRIIIIVAVGTFDYA
jgi:hypothetical protein